MSRPEWKINQDQISRHKWWWRLPQPTFTISEKGTTKLSSHLFFWKDGLEIASFRYELARRINRQKFPLSWLEISDDDVSQIRAMLSESTIPWVLTQGTHPIKVESEEPNYTEPTLFNLDCSDSSLVDEFKKFIAAQRIVKQVKAPKIIRKNAVSWRWLEVWDLNEIDHVPLNESMHSMKSKGTKAGEMFLPIVENAFDISAKLQKIPGYIRRESVRV